MTNLNATTHQAFHLKGSMFTLTVLQLLTADVNAFTTQLMKMIKRTPNFFKNAPVVIDLQKLTDLEVDVDLASICDEMRHFSLIPVAIRGGNASQQEAAIEAGLGLLSDSKSEATQPALVTAEPAKTAKIITQPIRSGQQIYAKQADLIVLAPVSAGAELLADGNIHIYDTLRGRALAGVSGNDKTRIFCRELQAELVSIAGHYKLQEDIQAPTNEPVQITFENGQLRIAELFT